jgi:hypothetical protein
MPGAAWSGRRAGSPEAICGERKIPGRRHAVWPIVDGWGFADDGFLDAATVVVSDPVANTVRLGGGVWRRLSRHDGQVTVSGPVGSPVVPQHGAGLTGRRCRDDRGACRKRWGVGTSKEARDVNDQAG